MTARKKFLAIIPARGGSKSVPKKNIKNLGGKPLIAWSIEVAKKISVIDKIVVSTDDTEIMEVAKKYDAFVMKRPQELATDDSLVIDTIKYTIEKLKENGETFEYVILLEPTCPFRATEDILKCLKLIEEKQLDSVATFTEASLHPYRAWRINNNTAEVFIDGSIPWLPRQKLPKAYQLNGAVYVARIDKIRKESIALFFGKAGAVIMPKHRSIDIDDSLDFIIAEAILKKQKEE